MHPPIRRKGEEVIVTASFANRHYLLYCAKKAAGLISLTDMFQQVLRRDIHSLVTQPPRVDYELTDVDCSFAEQILRLSRWAQDNLAKVKRAREAFDLPEQ
jgi:hypothetical protein